ncbi:hypothetical protein, partial [Tardiphaga sp. P5_C10]
MPEWVMVVLAIIGVLALLGFLATQARHLKELSEDLNKAAKEVEDLKNKLEENSGPLRKLRQATDPKMDFTDRLRNLEKRADEGKESLEEAIKLRATAHTELQILNTDLTKVVYDIGVDLDEVRVLVVPGLK